MRADAIPSPKLSPPRTDADRRWYRFYAMFSDAFARRVILDSAVPSGAVVLDPWLGVGTTTAAAANLGYRGVGVDINPAMVAVSSGRCTSREAADEAIA